MAPRSTVYESPQPSVKIRPSGGPIFNWLRLELGQGFVVGLGVTVGVFVEVEVGVLVGVSVTVAVVVGVGVSVRVGVGVLV